MSKKNLKNDYHKAHNNILHTASWLNLHATQSLKRFGVSPQQFNVLRILNEVHPKPATVKMLTERMIDKMSNASRLVEKLKKKGLVEREASDDDRRRVNVYITSAGLELLQKATQAIDDQVEKKMKKINTEHIQLLNSILDELRG